MTDLNAAVTDLAREHSGRVIALLAARFGDLDLADESVQDALVAASEWRVVPDNPPAWLYTVSRNNAIDRLRRAATERRRFLDAAPDLLGALGSSTAFDGADAACEGAFADSAEEKPMIVEDTEVGDEQLRLMLLCCHPALDREAQVALTLRLVAGLTTAEIAAAFMVPEATLAQRIVRAKRKIRAAGIPLSIPRRMDDRVQVLLTVLYLVFNEGYLARAGAPGIRTDLVEQAIRLTRHAAELLPHCAEVEGLLALELFTHARSEARFAGGELVLLDAQDRTLWDAQLIRSGDAVLTRALRRMIPGPFQLQAVIAGIHTMAPSSAQTNWGAIVAAYDQLAAIAPSPVVDLNRAIAVSMVDGPVEGLRLLDDVSGLDDYYLFWTSRGELLSSAGRRTEAVIAFERALVLAANPAELQHLRRRLGELRPL